MLFRDAGQRRLGRPLDLLHKPLFVDFFDSILDVFLTRISMEERSAILFNTQLRCEEEKVNGTIIMFVGKELQIIIIRIGEEWLA